MTIKPYPLQFKAEMKERIWGGRALEQFGLELPPGVIGEGWMIGDHPNGITSVMNGPLSGKGLDEIREGFGKEWFGENGYKENGRFPLLIKLLDCNDDLSIQVHPTDSYEGLPPGELGKTEMWYVLDAKPGAKIIYGLKDGIDRGAMEEAIREGRVMDTMQEVPVEAGDAFYIPAGTVHALCSGVLVAEIQQNSDTTYRLFDYNRPGLDGKLRELHIEDSLNVIAYEGAGAARMKTDGVKPGEWLTIASSPYFIVEKGVVEGSLKLSTATDSCVILVIAEGEGSLNWEGGSQTVKAGECFLLPATLGAYELDGSMTVLRSVIPSPTA
ncbi:type I phosphomannose isomerase catalytic subunit [Paenibacillus sp. HB172176]|uniref:type I phosphomannose isomerase catalytic subunit n=1 Tax=Paenibacillus sp. HB172176 TaxID=2493690 RepID=UPI00143B5982|nr:type I phosphomannose isomerase catalytic subunit [Paenibacillus sp. HB172176]